MRLAVFVLVLANLLLLGWSRGYLTVADNPDSRRVGQQLRAEEVKVVSRGDPPRAASMNHETASAVEKKNEKDEKSEKGESASVTEKKIADRCQSWREVAVVDADGVERLVTEKFPAFKVVRTAIAESNGYWVFIPPSATREDVSQKTAELQQQGVHDYFVVQASGPNRFAISLGTYRTEEAANAGLAVLRAKGVKTAKIGERIGKVSSNTLEIHGPENEADALRQAVAALLPKAVSSVCQEKAAEVAR
ncbi:MAG TPA: SPOR domain-containing protein [Accumulibacter sp.]|jgi:hypothetical protein|nr:SPOR domain-containing protein [Accumulibacter sp.]HQC80842.1 SPOR domain-containing protein [Accumulibacter sp.]